MLEPNEGVLGLAGLLADVPMDASAYRSVGSLLKSLSNRLEAAQTTFQKALECHPDPLQRFKINVGEADCLRLLGSFTEARQAITDCVTCIELEGVTNDFRYFAIITQARIEVECGNITIAAGLYAKAKTFNPNSLSWGGYLDQEVALYRDTDDHVGHIGVLKKWTPIDRLTWLVWGFEGFVLAPARHANFQDAALRAGEQASMIEVYEEAIRHLDNFNAAAPLRYELANAYIYIFGDMEGARRVLDEVLDSRSTGQSYKFSNGSPRYRLYRTVNLQWHVLLELFVKSSDPAVKSGLLKAADGLLDRPLATSVSSRYSLVMLNHDLTVARMALKIGPQIEFQTHLQRLMDGCFSALTNNVGWNDGFSLMALTKALALLSRTVLPMQGGKLWRAARILFSAVFSSLDEAIRFIPSHGNEEEEQAGKNTPSSHWTFDGWVDPPEDEGDLSHSPGNCGGTDCRPTTQFRWWGGRSGYLCLGCEDCLLCEECYAVLQADNSGETPIVDRRFCLRGHRFLKCPIEGWKGVKGGIINIEGSESVSFKDFLKNLREELCKEAWDEF